MKREWNLDIFNIIKAENIKQVSYVPDAGHSELIKLCQEDVDIHAISLTTEEEGIALSGGAWLGGDKSIMLLQSSGVGNGINMLALIKECRMPLVMLVTMRGEWGEFNPWQCPMGQSTQEALECAGVHVLRADTAQDVPETVQAALLLAFNSNRAVAVLISQRVIGIKQF